YRRAVNTLPQPQSRPGAWGLSSVGHFALQRDEALVVTVDALGAKYIAIQACDPWMVSRDYISKTGSLNKAQAEPNPDGTYTHVVSSADPGVRNWIDTDGLDAGTIFLRWQALPASAPSGASAIKSVQVVKLPLLAASLPPGTPRITPAQRADQLAQRAGDWRRRLGPEPIKVERGH